MRDALILDRDIRYQKLESSQCRRRSHHGPRRLCPLLEPVMPIMPATGGAGPWLWCGAFLCLMDAWVDISGCLALSRFLLSFSHSGHRSTPQPLNLSSIPPCLRVYIAKRSCRHSLPYLRITSKSQPMRSVASRPMAVVPTRSSRGGRNRA